MKKAEFEKYLNNVDKEDKVDYMIENGGLKNDEIILNTEDYLKSLLDSCHSYTEFAQLISDNMPRLSYKEDIRVDGEINSAGDVAFVTADTIADLFDDNEVDYFFDNCDPDDYDSILIELGA